MTEYESCYVFTPDETDASSQGLPKRRRIVENTNSVNGKSRIALEPLPTVGREIFVPLLRGLEGPDSVQARANDLYQSWRPTERSIDETIRYCNHDTFNEIVSFIQAENATESNGKLPTGLIVAGPGNGASLNLPSIVERLNSKERACLVNLSSGQSPNLKTTLKYINQLATNQFMGNDEDMKIRGSKDSQHLNYDLQILYEYVQSHSIRKVILVFEDSEAFEGTLLGDLVEVLSSWSDRIPFVLLFSIATSIDLFQNKLSRETIRRLSGAEFHVKQIDIETIFRDLHNEHSPPFFGSGLSEFLLQQRKDFIQSPSAFAQTLKYVYMTLFFADPLSILVCDSPEAAPLQKEHYEAIRHSPSFRRYAQDLIDGKNYDTVKDLLDDDESLNEAIMLGLEKSQKAVRDMLSALKVLQRIQPNPISKTSASWSELYIQAMSASLADSALLSDILDSIKTLPSDSMSSLLGDIAPIPSFPSALIDDLTKIKTDLAQLTSSLDDPNIPLRSAYDIHHSTLRATVVAQKVSLSKNSAKLSSQDTAYTEMVDRAFNTLTAYFETTLINPMDLFLNEVIIYDSKSPHRDVFAPKPRFVIERALSSPHDYLGCECCGGAGEGLSASQPATAILYQLYLESGSVINTADLWEAFWTIVGGEGGEDEEGERERVLALFSRALAELKYMGMVKSSRKKADHISKLAWKGL